MTAMPLSQPPKLTITPLCHLRHSPIRFPYFLKYAFFFFKKQLGLFQTGSKQSLISLLSISLSCTFFLGGWGSGMPLMSRRNCSIACVIVLDLADYFFMVHLACSSVHLISFMLIVIS